MDKRLLLLDGVSVIAALGGYLLALRQFEKLSETSGRPSKEGVPLERPAELDRRNFKGQN
jgi:hypothetical protein